MNLLAIVGILLLLAIGYLVYTNLFGSSTDNSNPVPLSAQDDEEEKDEEQTEFTLGELRKYNGSTMKKIYISVCGEVFDVSDSGFYGPQQPYEMFAGHDATLALARHEIKSELLDKVDIDVSKLPLAEQDTLNDTISHFQMKYSVVGWLKEWRDAHPDKSAEQKKHD